MIRVSLRQVRFFDLHAVNRIFKATMPMVRSADRRLALTRQKAVFAAVAGRRVCGFYVAWANADRAAAWLDYIAVDPALHLGGIGSMLLLHCEAAAREAGFGRVELSVRRENARVCRFYEQNGYRRSETSRESEDIRYFKELPAASKRRRSVFGSYRLKRPLEAACVILRTVILWLSDRCDALPTPLTQRPLAANRKPSRRPCSLPSRS